MADDLNYGLRPEDDEPATENPAREESGNPNDPMMPVAWTKTYQLPGGQAGKAFASTIGASTDLQSEGTRRLLVNAAYWCMGLQVPGKCQGGSGRRIFDHSLPVSGRRVLAK